MSNDVASHESQVAIKLKGGGGGKTDCPRTTMSNYEMESQMEIKAAKLKYSQRSEPREAD